MLTFEIVEGSLRISNVNSVILLISKQSVYVNTLSLQNAEPKVEIYNINLGTNAVVFAQPLSQCLDSAGNPFTVDSFILFAEVNLGFNGGGTPQPIPLPATSVKYSELVTLIQNSSLVPNTNYLISDYATIYDQPDYGADGLPMPTVATVQGRTEPLIVYAISEIEISNVALSTVYPNDTIFYDYKIDKTEYMAQPARGRINKRIDNELNLETGYDFRAVYYKRYLDENTGLYTVINNNGSEPLDGIYTFGTGCENIVLSNVRTGIADEPVFFMPNSIFGNDCIEISTLDNFYNNTFGNSCRATTFGYLCNNNVIGDFCQGNRILDNFSRNTIGSDFNKNDILNNFTENIIGNGFDVNKVGNDFVLNVIANKTPNNNIGDGFQNNRIKDGFGNNIIANNFANNIIDADFALNTIGNDFGNQGSNTIQADFNSNTISLSFFNNTISANFNRNQIFREFYANNIDKDFANNQIYAEITNIDFSVNPNVFYTKANVQVITGFDSEGSPIGQPFYGYLTISDKLMNWGSLNKNP